MSVDNHNTDDIGIVGRIHTDNNQNYRYLVVFVLGIVYSLNFLDRQLLSILAQPIKVDLNLSDTQLGLISGLMFAIFYTTLGVPIAWLADRVNRVHIVAAACAMWSLFTAACGYAQNFTQMAIARIGVGVGEAGGSPPSHSIISDYFSPQNRGFALALYSLGVPVGATLGSALGGWIAAVYNWRTTFIAIGVSGIATGLLVLLMVREPVRGGFDKVRIERPPLPQAITAFVRSPVLVLTALSGGCSAFVVNAMMSWTPAFLMRTKGMELTDIALYYSIVSGGGSAVGGLASGYLVDRLGHRNPRIYALLPAATFLTALPLYVGGVLAPTWQMSLACFAIPFALVMTFLAPALAVTQNCAPPAQRSTASALYLFGNNIIGLSLGPLYVGLVSDWVEPEYGVASLKVAMLALTPFFLVAVGSHLIAARSLGRAIAATH